MRVVRVVLLVSCLFCLGGWSVCDDTAPDGGDRHGAEPQLTATTTLLLAQSLSFRNRQYISGVSVHNFTYGFTEPSLFKYGPSQWLWDSCSAVISNSHTNPSRAVTELRTLFLQQQPDGRIAETAEWPSETVNEMTQMPVIPWAMQKLYFATKDLQLLKDLVPACVRYWEWWSATRDIDGGGLVTILHPWESGIDASPAYDAAWHVGNLSNVQPIAWLELYPLLSELRYVYRNIYHFNTTYILSRQKAEPSLLANWFMVQDVGINALYAAGWTLLSQLAAEYGDNELAASLRARGVEAEAAVQKMWNPQLKRFVTLYKDRDGSNKWSAEQGVQSLFPLLMYNLTSEQKSALIADASDPKKFWTAYPFPSASKSSSQYVAKYTVNLMWRGPSWGFTNWFVLEGLEKQGRSDLVAEVVSRWVSAVSSPYEAGGGIWEMWNADTGVGYGAEGLGMSSLLVDWMYRLNYVTPDNEPTPPDNENDVVLTEFVGSPSSSSSSSFDHGWFWLNATGSNAVIDAIAIQASTNTLQTHDAVDYHHHHHHHRRHHHSTEDEDDSSLVNSGGSSVITSVTLTYGDKRVAAFKEGWSYTVTHGGALSNSSALVTIPRDVNIVQVTACTHNGNNKQLAGLEFVLSNSNTISAGDLSSSAVTCNKLVVPNNKRFIGIRGRENKKNKQIDAIALVAFF